MILEVAKLNPKPGQEFELERAFALARPLIASCEGCLPQELHRCFETRAPSLLPVRWRTLDDHLIGFRRTAAYQEGKRPLHHFYEPFPPAEHFTEVR